MKWPAKGVAVNERLMLAPSLADLGDLNDALAYAEYGLQVLFSRRNLRCSEGFGIAWDDHTCRYS